VFGAPATTVDPLTATDKPKLSKPRRRPEVSLACRGQPVAERTKRYVTICDTGVPGAGPTAIVDLDTDTDPPMSSMGAWEVLSLVGRDQTVPERVNTYAPFFCACSVYGAPATTVGPEIATDVPS
jgi:hypothetical protein